MLPKTYFSSTFSLAVSKATQRVYSSRIFSRGDLKNLFLAYLQTQQEAILSVTSDLQRHYWLWYARMRSQYIGEWACKNFFLTMLM